ncbi:hypothetical protein Tco_1191434, partial [Tanacetum coccineum]
MEKKFVTNRNFQAIHKNFDNVLHDVIPKIASNATIDIIEDNLPKVIVEAVMKERDTFQETIPALISKEFVDHAPKLIEEIFYTYIHNNVITIHPTSSSSTATIDTFCGSDHDDHKKDDAPPKGEKRSKKAKDIKKLEICKSDVDKVIPEDDSPELIEEFQNVDKHVPTVYYHEIMEATLKDMTNSWHKRLYKINHIRVRANPEEYFFNHRIVEVIRATTEQQHGLDFLEQIIVMRENYKPNSFSKADFKYLNKTFIEDLYYLCRNKKVDYPGDRKLPDQSQLNCTNIDIP